MLKLTFYAIALVFSICTTAFCTEKSVPSLAERVNTSLTTARKVTLIYTDATDQTEAWTEEDYRRLAVGILTIPCGNSCVHIMSPVVEQLKRSNKLSKCPTGRKFLLIDIGAPHDLMYYVGGRVVRFGDQCFVADDRIDSVIHMFNFF